ncbi:MAG TPA: adenylate/guanylate cyclase domain-containing protein [Actinomycetota bacterium]|nr:adenylate/guanylate cyclase domain-containing protein [Actinomycetota bacterium]
MRPCPSCGEPNADSARFCSSCGARLESDEVRAVRKRVTVVFCDVADSTALGERLDPESLTLVLRRYFEEMQHVVRQHGGRAEKLIGDAVMGVFGVPRAHEDDALRGVRAAFDMREALEDLNVELEPRWGVRITTRIGVNTGEVMTRADTVDSEVSGAVLGDAVNVAARLQQTATPGDIVIGPETYQLTRGAVMADPVRLALKGKASEVTAYRLRELLPDSVWGPPRLRSMLVGRVEELRTLTEAFTQTSSDGAARVVTVVGEAGIGKSRLVEEFSERLPEETRVVRGRCLPYGEGITFFPLAEVVTRAAGIQPEDPAEVARTKLATVASNDVVAATVASLVGLDVEGVDPFESFWAVRRFFEALAGDGPLIVVFEDLHWAEQTFLDLLRHLADRVRGSLLFVCTTRPEFVQARPNWLAAVSRATRVLLGPLSAEESKTLMHNLLGAADLPPAMAARVAEAAEGNPLFVEEFLGMLIDERLLRRAGEQWVPATSLATVQIPPTIHALLAARLDQLRWEERAVLELASVIGKAFHRSEVEALAPLEARANLAEHLGTLVGKELVRPDVAGGSADSFRFHHILLRDATYEAMPKQLRQELHERFASWLEDANPDRATTLDEIVGYHLEQAHRYREELRLPDGELARRAVGHLGSAGRRALERTDLVAAVSLLGRAAEMLGSEPTEDGADLLCDLGAALHDVGELARAREVFEQASGIAEAVDHEAAAISAGVELGWIDLYVDPERVDTETVLREAEAAAERLDALGARRAAARSLRTAGVVRFWQGDMSSARALTERALEIATAEADMRGATWSVATLATILVYGDVPIPEAIERCRELLLTAGEHPGMRVGAWGALGTLEALRGNLDHGRELLGRARETAEDLALREILTGALQMEGWVELIAGRPEAAEASLRRSHSVFATMANPVILATVTGWLAEVLAIMGKFDEAAELTDFAERAAIADDPGDQIAWRRARARVLAAAGRFDEAVRIATEAVGWAEPTGLMLEHAASLLTLAEVLRRRGDHTEARAMAERGIELFRRKGATLAVEQYAGAWAGA